MLEPLLSVYAEVVPVAFANMGSMKDDARGPVTVNTVCVNRCSLFESSERLHVRRRGFLGAGPRRPFSVRYQAAAGPWSSYFVAYHSDDEVRISCGT